MPLESASSAASSFADSWGWSPSAVMLLVTACIFLVLKTLTLLHFERNKPRSIGLVERLAWFFAWPGMNPWQFFAVDAAVAKPTGGAWLVATAETIFGFVLFAIAAAAFATWNSLAGGWVAMVGLVFLLHFGLLHLVALLWRHAGRPVEPIMRAPVMATSLDDFWSRRWNLAFRDFASQFIFRPLYRRFGAAAAIVGCFGFSGLVHDLGISVPARGGYGLPTAYFLLQGAGVLAERSAWGRRIGLGRGWRGWIFAAAITAPAAFLLFHPPFVRNVILPLIPK